MNTSLLPSYNSTLIDYNLIYLAFLPALIAKIMLKRLTLALVTEEEGRVIMTYKIFYEKKAAVKDLDKLGQGLAEHADVMKGHLPGSAFTFFIRDNKYKIKGKVKGGCHGCIYYGCLYVDQLWIDETLRHQGYGTQLMQAAEKLAREESCLFMTVCTMDWEALNFYKKLGFVVEFERHGYLKDSVLYFLRKNLH